MILAAVVNKLGDRSKVLASCVIHKLRGIGKFQYSSLCWKSWEKCSSAGCRRRRSPLVSFSAELARES